MGAAIELRDDLDGAALRRLAKRSRDGGQGRRLLALPPRSPELNPVENVWQFMRDNWLSSRVFGSFDDIVALCCEAWNKLTDQPWRIMTIGARDWAHGF